MNTIVSYFDELSIHLFSVWRTKNNTLVVILTTFQIWYFVRNNTTEIFLWSLFSSIPCLNSICNINTLYTIYRIYILRVFILENNLITKIHNLYGMGKWSSKPVCHTGIFSWCVLIILYIDFQHRNYRFVQSYGLEISHSPPNFINSIKISRTTVHYPHAFLVWWLNIFRTSHLIHIWQITHETSFYERCEIILEFIFAKKLTI